MRFNRPTPKQARSIREAKAKINIWHGAVRAGKTVAAQLAMANRIRHHDGNGDIALIGRTERTLKRNILTGDGGLLDLLGQRNFRLNEGKGEAHIYGRRCYLFSANDARSEGKIRGGTFAVIGGDELSLWPESVFGMAITRLSPKGAQLFGTTNPDSPRHWLKRDWIDRAGEMDLRHWHFTVEDNAANLPPDYIPELKRQFTGLWRKRFVDGLWALAEGAIWDMFDPERHACHTELPKDVEIRRYFVGVDYGTANPFVALLCGLDQRGRVWVLSEWRWDSRQKLRQLTDAQYSKAVGEWIERHGVTPSTWWVDPETASFRNQLRQDHPKWNVRPAVNAVDDGLRTVATLLQADGLHVLDGECEPLLEEIPGYCWDPRKQALGEDAPIKQEDHGPDALRYAVHSELCRPNAGLLNHMKRLAALAREAAA